MQRLEILEQFLLDVTSSSIQETFEALAEVEITNLLLWAVPLFRRSLLAPFSRLK
jgi:hypothetical protein